MSEDEGGSGPAEHGDRASFLDRIRSRQGPPPSLGPHPPPAPPDTVPAIGYRSLDDLDPEDPDALLPVFVAAVRAAEAVVDVVDGEVPAELLLRFVAEHEVRTAVTSLEPEAVALGAVLAAAGVEISPYDRETAAAADLGVTSATHAVAATGSLVVDSAIAGSRAVSLLPRVHLCVLPRSRLVASHADVLRHQIAPMPSARVLITGPSRTGDIEQLLTLGAHGPVALHVIVTR
jgi:L-lactate dehydrogenase complex protein LldG